MGRATERETGSAGAIQCGATRVHPPTHYTRRSSRRTVQSTAACSSVVECCERTRLYRSHTLTLSLSHTHIRTDPHHTTPHHTTAPRIAPHRTAPQADAPRKTLDAASRRQSVFCSADKAVRRAASAWVISSFSLPTARPSPSSRLFLWCFRDRPCPLQCAWPLRRVLSPGLSSFALPLFARFLLSSQLIS